LGIFHFWEFSFLFTILGVFSLISNSGNLHSASFHSANFHSTKKNLKETKRAVFPLLFVVFKSYVSKFSFSSISDWNGTSHWKCQHEERAIVGKTSGFDEKFANSSQTGVPEYSLRRERM
jgi:hypothetical protein